MKVKRKLTVEEIQSRIRENGGTMAQEGMFLTEKLRQKLYNCLFGKNYL